MVHHTKKSVTLFDLDHTLIPDDSDQQWGAFTYQIGWTDKKDFLHQSDKFYQDYKAGVLDMPEYVRFATKAIRERGKEASLKAREQYIEKVIKKLIHPQAIELVRMHQLAGDLVAIVTATNRFVVEPICQLFNVQEILAVELASNGQWYTGEIQGTPSAREGKVVRVEQWLKAQGLSWETVHTTFYSDSHNDIALLSKVDVPIATNPDEVLRKTAIERSWKILELFTTQ